MVLLVIVAVGLLSLSSIALRSSSREQDLAVARANARLALALAIGELQKHAGPDQRITAPASILDVSPDTLAIDGVGEPQVTGVWESNKQDAGKDPTIPDYNKPGAFRRWLVSGLGETGAADPAALSADRFRSTPQGVRLVGQNTTKDSSPTSSVHLWAGKVPLASVSQGGASGHLAYAVMDEGVKARINLEPPSSLTHAERLRSAAGAPLRNALDQLKTASSGQGESLDPYFEARRNAAKAVTVPTARLLKQGLPDLGPYFQDLTTDSAGVLADVTLGGLRKDLSLFGELTSIPGAYEKRRIYSDTDSPLAFTPGTTAYNSGAPDPHWKMIYDHLNIQKRLSGAANLPTLDVNTVPAGFAAGSGSGASFIINRDAQSRNPLAPVIVRCEVMFSFFAKEPHDQWIQGLSRCIRWWRRGQQVESHASPDLHANGHSLESLQRDTPTQSASSRNRQSARLVSLHPSWKHLISIDRRNYRPPRSTLDEMYIYDSTKYDKKFVMQLFGQVSSSGVASGDVVLLPGEVKLFSPAMDPNWDWLNVMDWQNDMTDRSAQIKAAPGWRGPQYGFNIDYLAGNMNTSIARVMVPAPRSVLSPAGSMMSGTSSVVWRCQKTRGARPPSNAIPSHFSHPAVPQALHHLQTFCHGWSSIMMEISR
jgi:hypothetical protein